MGRETVQSDGSSLTFRRNVLPPSSGSKRKTNKNSARRRKAEFDSISRFVFAGFLFDFLFDPEAGGTIG
jgi:hypothetical protein